MIPVNLTAIQINHKAFQRAVFAAPPVEATCKAYAYDRNVERMRTAALVISCCPNVKLPERDRTDSRSRKLVFRVIIIDKLVANKDYDPSG